MFDLNRKLIILKNAKDGLSVDDYGYHDSEDVKNFRKLAISLMNNMTTEKNYLINEYEKVRRFNDLNEAIKELLVISRNGINLPK